MKRLFLWLAMIAGLNLIALGRAAQTFTILHDFAGTDGQSNAVATREVATSRFAVGPHSVQLLVSDGADIATAQVSFEVITPAAAVGQLMRSVDESNFPGRNKQPLLASLSAAISSFERGNFDTALNQLFAFQHKVRAQLTPRNPVLASELTAASEQIITVVSGR